MADTNTYESWIGAPVYDENNDKFGDITNIYLDDRSGQPEWITVDPGATSGEKFVPIAGSKRMDDGLAVAYSESLIRDAPGIDSDMAHLDADEERRLYEHYSLDYDADDHEKVYGGRERADEGYEYAHDDDYDRDVDVDTTRDGSVTLSEEELDVQKREHEAGRVRLQKYVVTEDVNMTVPVRKQVARVVREPIAGREAGTIDADGDSEEIVLSEEEVTVTKDVVAKERVGLDVDTVTEQETVSGEVRKERVEVEGADVDVDRDVDRDRT